MLTIEVTERAVKDMLEGTDIESKMLTDFFRNATASEVLEAWTDADNEASELADVAMRSMGSEAIITSAIESGSEAGMLVVAALGAIDSHDEAAAAVIRSGIEPESVLKALLASGSEKVETMLRVPLGETDRAVIRSALVLFASVNRAVERMERAAYADTLRARLCS